MFFYNQYLYNFMFQLIVNDDIIIKIEIFLLNVIILYLTMTMNFDPTEFSKYFNESDRNDIMVISIFEKDGFQTWEQFITLVIIHFNGLNDWLIQKTMN